MVNDKRVKPKRSALHADHRKRVKSKFLKFGFGPFSEHEVLELLLFFALPHVDTNEIAHELINKGGSFLGAFNLSENEMKSIPGIKNQTATFLKFISELIQYYRMKETVHSANYGLNYSEIAKMCKQLLFEAPYNSLLCIYFDRTNNVITGELLNTYNFFNIDRIVEAVIKRTLNLNAVSLVLAHNDPTLGIIPMTNDINFTITVKKLLEEFNITLIEHFVFSENRYFGIIEENNKIVLMDN